MQRIRASFLAASCAALISLIMLPAATAGAATRDAPLQQDWAPDVASRIAELRERADRAAAEALDREARLLAQGQWWRLIAVSPVEGGAQSSAAATPTAERVR